MTFKEIADNAFNQIRQSVKVSVAVRIRLLEAIAQIADHTYCSDHIEGYTREAFIQLQNLYTYKFNYFSSYP